jgi:hypothetical protein
MRIAPHQSLSTQPTVDALSRLRGDETVRPLSFPRRHYEEVTSSTHKNADGKTLVRIDSASSAIDPPPPAHVETHATRDLPNFGTPGLYRLVGLTLVALVCAGFWTSLLFGVARMFGTSLATPVLVAIASCIFFFAVMAAAPFVARKNDC